MRKTILALTAAGAVLAGGMAVSTPGTAMTLAAPDAVRGAAATINPVEQAGCWRYGWHGWGWYPFCRRVIYGYGFGRPWWGWHRHHRWHHW